MVDCAFEHDYKVVCYWIEIITPAHYILFEGCGMTNANA